MFWTITAYPRCEHHVFLSHCALDRPGLVHPVYNRLQTLGIIPWLDRDHYYYGRDSRTALRDGLLKSRHVVFFVTLGMMDYRRGWCPMELAYSDLLQANMAYMGGPLLNYQLPLFFIDPTNLELAKTIWSLPRDWGRFHHPRDGDPVDWAVGQIVDFLHREQNLALDMARVIIPGQQVHADLMTRPGLIDRVTRFDPGGIP
jgi:hypothetical protein